MEQYLALHAGTLVLRLLAKFNILSKQKHFIDINQV